MMVRAIQRHIDPDAYLNLWNRNVANTQATLKTGWSISFEGRELGYTGGVTVPSGYVGERLAPATETFSYAAFPRTGTATTLHSLSITPGVWMVYGFAVVPLGTLTGHTLSGLGISTTTNNLTSTNVREAYVEFPTAPSADADLHLSCFRYLNVATTATYYLVGIQTASGGSTTWTDVHGRSIYAVRIA